MQWVLPASTTGTPSIKKSLVLGLYEANILGPSVYEETQHKKTTSNAWLGSTPGYIRKQNKLFEIMKTMQNNYIRKIKNETTLMKLIIYGEFFRNFLEQIFEGIQIVHLHEGATITPQWQNKTNESWYITRKIVKDGRKHVVVVREKIKIMEHLSKNRKKEVFNVFLWNKEFWFMDIMTARLFLTWNKFKVITLPKIAYTCFFHKILCALPFDFFVWWINNT